MKLRKIVCDHRQLIVAQGVALFLALAFWAAGWAFDGGADEATASATAAGTAAPKLATVENASPQENGVGVDAAQAASGTATCSSPQENAAGAGAPAPVEAGGAADGGADGTAAGAPAAETENPYAARIKALRAAKPDEVMVIKLGQYMQGIAPLKKTDWTFEPQKSWECYKDPSRIKDMWDSDIAELRKQGVSRAHLMSPRVVSELKGWISDTGEGVLMVDPAQGNRFFTDWDKFKISTRGGKDWVTPKTVDDDEGDVSEACGLSYVYLGSFSNGVHVVEVFEYTGGSWWSNQLMFFVFEKVKLLNRDVVVLRTLGTMASISRATEEVLEFSLKDDVLTLDQIHNQGFFNGDPAVLKRFVLKVTP